MDEDVARRAQLGGIDRDRCRLRCFACGSSEVIYKLAKVFCARCNCLIANCCGD